MPSPDEVMTIVTQLAESWSWKMETRRSEPNRIDVVLPALKDLLPFVTGLRVQRLGYLSTITGLDPGVESGQLELLYHFSPGPALITLRLRVPREGARVPSLSEIIPSAESAEREVREMFGVEFDGLRNPDRLYLPDDWPAAVFPQRKDYKPNGRPAAGASGPSGAQG
ncbi:MAG TPA: NADH-quinone oxidoreductase subunit C [Anaerolineales bacterium]|nr:NADH-quinone oxidoreductase subunit C [Anaerolineales bacterium]